MKFNKKLFFIFFILISLFIFLFILNISIGTYSLSLKQIINVFFGNGSKLENFTIFDLRLPRIFVALTVAIGLSMSALILQNITKNELAEPGIIGINSGAALAVVLLISFGKNLYYNELPLNTSLIIPFFAILGAIFSSLLIYFISGFKNSNKFILAGLGINIAINAFITLQQLNMSKGDFNQVLTWTSGSLWGSSWLYFFISAPVILALTIAIFFKFKTLNVLSLGDETAIGLGVSIKKEKTMLIIMSIFLAAISTAVAGNIAFLGLIAPHMAKILVGHDYKKIIPASILIGCIIIMFADIFSRNLFSPLEIPVGITISIVGVPYFIYLMIKQK